MLPSPRAVLALLLVLGAGTSARADTVTLNFVPGTLYQTTALGGFATTGADMGGVRVTAYLADGSSEVAIWSPAGISGPGAYGTGWSLRESGDTFTAPWTLTNSTGQGLKRFVVDGDPGDTIFDVIASPNHTPGSSAGKPFTVPASFTTPTIVTYRDRIQLTGASPLGDLYRQMEVEFDVAGGLASGKSMVFRQDTDKAKLINDIKPVKTPAPPAILLALLGVVPFLGRRRG